MTIKLGAGFLFFILVLAVVSISVVTTLAYVNG